MRALIVASWYPSPNDPTAGVFIQQQVRALAALDDLDIAVLHVDVTRDFAPSASQEDGVMVVRAGVAASSLARRFLGYRRVGLAAYGALREAWGAPEIVHVQALWPAGLIGRAIARREHVPYVVTEHSEEYLAASRRRLVRTPGMLPLVLRPLARGAAAHVAVSRFLGARLVELGLAENPAVIPNVVPDTPAAPAVTAAPHAIAHVSVMGPAKNLDELLRAIALLARDRDDFVLRLVGDGECRTELERLAVQLGLGARVEFLGVKSVEQVRDVYAASAFAVVSSTHETFSVVAAEALMNGRPVLTTPCGGPEEFVTPEVGRVTTGTSAEDLAEGLDWMLDHIADFDPDALHAYARERFSPDAVAHRVTDVYRSALNG